MSTRNETISDAIAGLKTRLVEKDAELASLDSRYQELRTRLISERDAIADRLLDLEASYVDHPAPVPGGPARSAHSNVPIPPGL